MSSEAELRNAATSTDRPDRLGSANADANDADADTDAAVSIQADGQRTAVSEELMRQLFCVLHDGRSEQEPCLKIVGV